MMYANQRRKRSIVDLCQSHTQNSATVACFVCWFDRLSVQ